MKSSKFFFILMGFVAGISYMIACGSVTPSMTAAAEDVASAISNAIDVVFSTETSGLAATNVQDAIDEVEARVDTLEDTSFDEFLVGSWSGTFYASGGSGSHSSSGETFSGHTFTGNSLTLNPDGTFSCSGQAFDEWAEDELCDFPIRWGLISRTVLSLIYTDSDEEGQILMLINSADNTTLELLNDGFNGVYVLTRS